MEISAYIQILQLMRAENRPFSPRELSVTLGKSRVTIQSTLKRLMKNGWVEKLGESPKTAYRALELTLVPRETQEKDIPALEAVRTQRPAGLLEAFIYKTNAVAHPRLTIVGADEIPEITALL